jgi:hypothetical protein
MDLSCWVSVRISELWNVCRSRESAHWPTYAALALAFVAVVLAGLAYFYPAHGAAPVAQQGGEAKANVCAAYVTVREGVVLSTHQQSPNQNDPVGQMSVATNARVSLIDIQESLRRDLDSRISQLNDMCK